MFVSLFSVDQLLQQFNNNRPSLGHYVNGLVAGNLQINMRLDFSGVAKAMRLNGL